MTTLEQLKLRYSANYIHLGTLLQDHFTHITSEEHFLRKVKEGKIKIKVNHLTASRRSPRIVFLSELARYLDNHEQENI